MGRSELAFRAQLVIPEQRQLYDYWCDRAGARKMPSRTEIKPGDIPDLLPLLSLIDVERDPNRYRVRLAGTSLYDVYAGEITGKYVDELGWGRGQDYWQAAYRRVADVACPAQGIVKAPSQISDHLVQFWLRLPMSRDGHQVDMILSYDAFIPVSRAEGLTSQFSQIGADHSVEA
ncbi:MAG: PAS domain-containing protein [Alphaproteobacteria bacterium]